MIQIRSIPFVVLAALVLSGCSSGYKQGAKASESVMSAAQKIEDGRAQLDKVTTSLDKLVNAQNQNLAPLFKEYSSNVDKLDAIAKDVKKQADAMRSKGQEYFKEWDAELAKINNEDIKTRSAERRTAVEQSFQRLSDASQRLKAEYQPLMSDLQDIRTALNNDLTPSGIQSIKPIAERVMGEAARAKHAAGQVSAEFKALGVQMSSKPS
jgi:DNA repair exonuclease SbcCD ATPase subunit